MVSGLSRPSWQEAVFLVQSRWLRNDLPLLRLYYKTNDFELPSDTGLPGRPRPSPAELAGGRFPD